jgi:hypothetical protein
LEMDNRPVSIEALPQMQVPPMDPGFPAAATMARAGEARSIGEILKPTLWLCPPD